MIRRGFGEFRVRAGEFQVQFSDSAMGGQPGGRLQVRDSLFFANELEHLTDYFLGASRGHLVIDWTLDGTHLCNIRLRLLRLNTMPAVDLDCLADVTKLRGMSSAALRDLGRLPHPMVRRAGEAGFKRVSWDTALDLIAERIRLIVGKTLHRHVITDHAAHCGEPTRTHRLPGSLELRIDTVAHLLDEEGNGNDN